MGTAPNVGDPPEFGNLPLGWGHRPGWGWPHKVGETPPWVGPLSSLRMRIVLRLETPPGWGHPSQHRESPQLGIPGMGTPHPAWGHPSKWRSPYNGDTPPCMGATPPRWGHHFPPMFPFSDTGVAGAASTQGGIRLGGWEGSGFGGTCSVPCAGGEH